MTFVYYLGLFLCGAASTFSMQKYGRAAQNRTGFLIYALITGLIAMGVFYATAGFSIALNAQTIFYAVIMAVLAMTSYFTELPVYKYMEVAEVVVITTGGTLIFSSLAGVLLFSEALTIISVLRIVLMLAAILVLFAENKQPHSHRAKHVSLPGWILCALIIVIGTINTVLSKYIAIDVNVTNSDSLFFFANVLISIVSLLFLLLESRGCIGTCVAELRAIPPSQYLTILVSTVSSNFTSLLGVLILAQGNITLFVPLSNALKLLASEAVVIFALHERPKIIPVLLATASMLLGFFG